MLRHSAATDWLRQGSSLELIGVVLRHRCIESTAHYAKVDVAMLRSVAQPWPHDGESPCIPQHVFAYQRQRPFPTLFSPEQLRQLLDATARLRPEDSLRPHTYYTLFALLAATGLRISEALHLLLDDVTPDGLVVRKTKFHKSRLVPLHETTDAALQRYLEQRKAVGGGDDHLFISTTGGALTYAMVNGTFHYPALTHEHTPDGGYATKPGITRR